MRKLLPVLLLLVLLASCATAPKYDTFVSIKGANSPQAQFAAEEISKSLSESGIGISDENSQWTIRFADIDSELGEQTYHIEVLGKIIEITGGDERGLMLEPTCMRQARLILLTQHLQQEWKGRCSGFRRIL